MRMRVRVALVTLAVLLVSGTVTAVVAAQRGAPSAAPADCSAYEGNQKERCENAQAQQRQERMRRHCAENPRDTPCQRMAAAERERAYCAEHPREERCRA